MKARTFLLTFACMIAFLCVSFAGPPLLPASYYGSVHLNGGAVDDIAVYACVDGESRGSRIASEGTYGIYRNLRLSANGTSADTGKTVYFYLGGCDGLKANEEVEWASGDVREIDLTFSGDYDEEPDTRNPGSSGGNGGTPQTTESSNESSGDLNSSQSTPEPESTEEVEITETITEGWETSFEFQNSWVSAVKVIFTEQVENPALTLEILGECPPEVSELSGKKMAYKFISIDKNFDSAKIESAKIEFRVETAWMSKNKISPEDVVLLHYNAGEWTELPTTLTGAESEHYRYVAETDSFSVFAIAAKTSSSISTGAYALVIVLALLLIIAFFAKRPKKHSSKHISKKGYRYNISKKR